MSNPAVLLIGFCFLIIGGGGNFQPIMIANKILLGDNIETLKTLPDNTVDCCITSPPYYCLRDYGTARWEGGDPDCDHRKRGSNKVFGNSEFNKNRPSREKTLTVGYSSVCEKCGAVRIDNQIGLEETPGKYVEKLVYVFREVRRILREDGTLWVNIGDSYCSVATGTNKQDYSKLGGGKATQIESCKRPDKKPNGDIKQKDLIGIPWMLAFALRADGWYLRQDIIWHKPNVMPESVTDRCTKSHEYIFLLSKSRQYYFNNEAIKEPALQENRMRKDRVGVKQDGIYNPGDRVFYGSDTRNKRDVWIVNTKPNSCAHFATYPEELIIPCILAGSHEGGIVLDPFIGSGTTAVTAVKLLRKYIGCEINPEYIKIAEDRISSERGLFNE